MQLRSRVASTTAASIVAAGIVAAESTDTKVPHRRSAPAIARGAARGGDAAVKVEIKEEPVEAALFSSSARPSRRAKRTSMLPHAMKQEPDEAIDAVKGEDDGKAELLTSPATKKKKTKRASATDDPLRVKREEPKQWKDMLLGIQEMRAKRDAEVDTMGCETHVNDKVAPHVWRFHTLVSAMLSSQTKDPINAAAMERLIGRKGGLTVQAMLDIDENELAQIIHPVGFYRNKAKYIKQVAEILTEEAAGSDVVDIPNTFEGLLALPGVGPKMAYLVMDCAWNNVVGICVDTHVHRISNRLGWVNTWNKKNPKAQDPEKTRAELQDWLPHEHWGPINVLLVGFGQTICQPRNPKCTECKISHLCPSANKSII